MLFIMRRQRQWIDEHIGPLVSPKETIEVNVESLLQRGPTKKVGSVQALHSSRLLVHRIQLVDLHESEIEPVGTLTVEQRTKLLGQKCPVCRTLTSDIEIRTQLV